MKLAVTSEEMKKIDEYSVQVLKIPALELMERAAQAIADTVIKRIGREDRILIVSGQGNNGGDGIAAGRILFLQGCHVAILFIGDKTKASEAAKFQLERAVNLSIPLENSNKLHEYNIIIDAVFGIGLSRNITGIYKEIIDEINGSKNTVFAVDIPSGISADDGKVMNTAVRADYTISFGHMKKGLLLYPGAEYAGEITVADIGFPPEATLQGKPDTFYYEEEDLKLLPLRKKYSHKGTFGKVLVIAGSKGMSGAAFLSAKAAYRTGAGLVKVLTSEANRIIIQTSLPEALFSSYDEVTEYGENYHNILEDIRWASVIIIGPGLGKTDRAGELLETVLEYAKVPVIIDADAINLLGEKLNSAAGPLPSDRLRQLSLILKAGTILTPHLMELSRLTGKPLDEITDNLIDTASQCSYNSNLIYAIKDARTIVSTDGRRYINVSGNNGMATGGSGDVLTGIIAACIAQGMEAFDAACLAVYIHGAAGDAAADERGTYSMMAGDIADSIDKVIKRRERLE